MHEGTSLSGSDHRTKTITLRIAGFLFLIASGLVVYAFCHTVKRPIVLSQSPLHGLVLSGVQVLGLTGGLPDKGLSSADGDTTSGSFMEWIQFPKLQQQLQLNIPLRLQRGGVPFLPTPSQTSDGYYPTISPQKKAELVASLDAHKRGNVVYYHIDIALEQPVFLNATCDVTTTATTWHANISGGAPVTAANQAISQDTYRLVDSFLNSYHLSNRR